MTCNPLPAVMGDPTRLEQLFQNLVGNAITFHGKEQPPVYVSAGKRGTAWVFSVYDNGSGIDPQYSGRIFEIFERLRDPALRYSRRPSRAPRRRSLALRQRPKLLYWN